MMDVGLSAQQKGPESTIADTMLSAQQFYQHDPLLVLLKDKWRLNDLWIIAGVIVLPGGVFLLWWLSNLHPWDLAETLNALLQTFVIFPLIFLIYLRVPTSIAGLFNTLRANGVIGEHRRDRHDSESYEHFLQRLVTWTDRGWWTAGALAVVVLYFLYRVVLMEPQIPSNLHLPVWLRVVAFVMFLPVMYAACMSVVRLLLTLVFTNWLCYVFTIRVKPLHPDGSGGLSVLRRILWISVVIMLWDALLLGTAILTSHLRLFSLLEMILLGSIYVALTPSLLIGWLVLPHRVMVKARDEALLPLANEFQQAMMQTVPSVKDDTSMIVASTTRLSALKERYDLVRDTFPTWPLQIRELRRVVATASLPALLTALLPVLLPPFLPQLISFVSHTFGLMLK